MRKDKTHRKTTQKVKNVNISKNSATQTCLCWDHPAVSPREALERPSCQSHSQPLMLQGPVPMTDSDWQLPFLSGSGALTSVFDKQLCTVAQSKEQAQETTGSSDRLPLQSVRQKDHLSSKHQVAGYAVCRSETQGIFKDVLPKT